MDELNNKVNDLNNKINELINTINSLKLELHNVYKVYNNNVIITNSLVDNMVSNSINESIVLYSIKNDPFIKKLNLDKNKCIIRTCRSNIHTKEMLVKRITRTSKDVTIYKQYEVSNPHNISMYIINKLQFNTNINIKFYFSHFIIDIKDKDLLLNKCDDIINEFKLRIQSLLNTTSTTSTISTTSSTSNNNNDINNKSNTEIKKE